MKGFDGTTCGAACCGRVDAVELAPVPVSKFNEAANDEAEEDNAVFWVGTEKVGVANEIA